MKITADQLLKIAGIAPSTTLRSRLNESFGSLGSTSTPHHRVSIRIDAYDGEASVILPQDFHDATRGLRDVKSPAATVYKSDEYYVVTTSKLQAQTQNHSQAIMIDARDATSQALSPEEVAEYTQGLRPIRQAIGTVYKGEEYLVWVPTGSANESAGKSRTRRTVKEAAANSVAISAAAHKKLTDMLTWLNARPKGFPVDIFEHDEVGTALDGVLQKELGGDFNSCKLNAGVLSCLKGYKGGRVTLTSKSGGAVKESDGSAHNPYGPNEPGSAEFVQLVDAGETMTALVVDRDWSDNGRDYCYDMTASIGGQQLKVQCLFFDRELDRLVTRAMDGKANALKKLTEIMSDQIKNSMG